MSHEEKPSRNEDEYFVRLDAELIKERRARLDAERAQQERRSHFMKCPKCGADLVETDLQNVKIDRCPECEGLWFDRGELDLLASMTGHAEDGGVRQFLRGVFGLRR